MAQPKLLAHPQSLTTAEAPKRKIINEAFPDKSVNTLSSIARSSYRPPGTTKSPPAVPSSGKAFSPSSLAKSTTPKTTFAAIDRLRTELPEIPYLITLQPGCPPFPGKGRYESHHGTPFETWEYERYQHMSFVPCEGLKEGAVLEDRELLNSLGDWREASKREERKYYKWREEEERRREVEGKVREMESGRNTPWGSGANKVVPQTGTGSGGNTERKKVNFADYLKKKKTSPSDTPARVPNGAVPQVKVNGIDAAPSDTSKSTEAAKDTSLFNPPSMKPDLSAKAIKNGALHKPHTGQARPSAPDKEEGELADEPPLPSSIANTLRAPPGREPGLRQPSVPPQPRVSTEKKKPVDDAKRLPDEKRRKVEGKPESKPEPPKQPYTGSARPAGHHRAASGNIFDRLSGRGSRESSKPSTPLPPKRDDERRKSLDRGAPAKNAMPRLLSPLPHMSSTNGTPMARGDSNDSRRGGRSPLRSQPMQKSESRDSNRGRDRSPLRSQPMKKENLRDGGRDRDERRRSRSPMRVEPVKKSASRDSQRERGPKRDEHRRSRSPPRSQPMKKENSKDARRDLSPVKRDEAPSSKPKLGVFGGKTTTPSSVAKKEPTKEATPKKEPIPMPAMLSFDLPSIVQDDMKRRLDNGELKPDVAAAYTKVTGHKRNTSNISNASQATAITNGSTKREREETPVTESERAPKKTSTQAARERARKGDTPGVARKAVASKTRARQESKVVRLHFDEDDPAIAEKIKLILQTKPERDHALSDYQSHRGRNMINRRTEAVKAAQTKQSINKRQKTQKDEESEDEEQSPVQRKRQQPSQHPSTPRNRDQDSGFGAESLAPLSISKLKQEPTPDKAGTPGAAAAGTPTQQPVSPTATRSAPSTHALTDAQKAEVKKLRAEYDRYISLGTSLKRQRDALIRPSPDSGSSRTVSEADAKKASIIGVESLLAYLVGFEAMDRAYRIEGTRNRGQHWKSLFPYLDSFRLGLKGSGKNEGEEKMRVVLDIVATLVGYTGASCLAVLLNSVLEKDGPPNSREAMQEFIKEQTGNFKRREAMAEFYKKRCLQLNERWPDLVANDRALAWVKTAGGQFGGVNEVRGNLSKIVKELCLMSKVDWQAKLDF